MDLTFHFADLLKTKNGSMKSWTLKRIPIVIFVSLGKLYSMSIGCINNIISNSKYYYYTFWFSLFSSVLAVVLNIYLISEFGIIGAAYATLIVLIIMNSLKTIINI